MGKKKWPTYEEIAQEMKAQEKWHHESLQEIRQQAETIVTEVYNGSQLQKLLYRAQEAVYLFDGKIGTDIYFAGAYHEYAYHRDRNYAEIDLHFQGEKLGKIKTQNGFVNDRMSGWISNWQGDSQNVEQPIADATAITVISPAWCEKDGTGSIYYPKDVTRKVEITHAPKERAENVLAKIYRAIARSKRKAMNAQKLGKLNIVTKSTDLIAGEKTQADDRVANH